MFENKNNPENNLTVDMETKSAKSQNGVHTFKGKITSKITGQLGYTVRILPKNPLLISQFDLGLVYWADQ